MARSGRSRQKTRNLERAPRATLQVEAGRAAMAVKYPGIPGATADSPEARAHAALRKLGGPRIR